MENIHLKSFANIRIGMIACVCLLYALFGSPTPDTVSWVEITMGIMLVISVGIVRAIYMATAYPLFDRHSRNMLHYRIAALIFSYLIFIPTVSGFLTGVRITDWIRDIIPLLFLFLPFFLWREHKDQKEKFGIILIIGASITGVAFSIRFLIMMDIPLWAIGADLGKDAMLYLPSDPCVLFSALFLPLWGIKNLLDGNEKRLSYRLLFLFGILGGLCGVVVLAATLQRAGLLFVILGYSVFAFIHALHNIKIFVVFCISFACLLAVFWNPIMGVLTMVIEKTIVVGDNARFAELRSVIDLISSGWQTLIFGKGWGSLVYSSAAGYVWVRYTHMMLSYFLLKCGFIGVMMVVIYGYYYLRYAWKLVWRDGLLGYALIVPLFCSAVFTTGFKTLGFGILLSALLYITLQTDNKNDDLSTD